MEKLTEFERITEQVAGCAEEKSKFDARLAKAKQAVQDYLDETQQEREELLGRRREGSEGLPPTALATFTRVAEKHDGEGLAEVIRLHPKREEYACGGCNMTVPLDHVNALAAPTRAANPLPSPGACRLSARRIRWPAVVLPLEAPRCGPSCEVSVAPRAPCPRVRLPC